MVLRKSRFVALAAVPAIALMAGAGFHATPAASAERQCPSDCGTKVEHAPWTLSGDRVITGVCIKAGTGLTGFDHDGSNGCYTVTGIGTPTVVVTGGGTSRECKDISNVVFYYDCGGGGGGGGGGLPG